MEGYPALEVLAAPDAPKERTVRAGDEPGGLPGGMTVGRLVALKDRFIVGRRRDADLLLDVAGVHRSHCLVEQRFGRWWLLDLGGTSGTCHNGERVTNVELQHLDVIELVPGLVLRFLTRPRVELRDAEMEGALAEAPDDAGRWAVYADWLLEHDAELGERIARPKKEHDGRWLGALATSWARGDLEVEWAFGLPRGLVLRRLAMAPAPMLPRTMLAHVVSDPSFRFVRSLDIDIESLVLAEDWDEALAGGLELLARTPLPLLESLRVGPVAVELEAPRTRARLDLLRQRCPRLVATSRSPFLVARAAELLVLSCPAAVVTRPAPGATVSLRPEGPNLVGRLEDCAVVVRAPEGHPAGLVAVSLASTDGRWRVEDLFARARPFRRLEFALRVNGHEVVEASLRPGDTMELAAGLLLRFLA